MKWISNNIPTLIYTAFALFILYYLQKFLISLYYYIKLRWFFPGPKSVSILGHNITDLGESDLQKFESYVQQYPRMHRVVYVHTVRILVSCPELIAQIYTEVLDKDNTFFDLVKPLLGNGLFMSSGEIWKRNRRLLTPLFHSKCLERFSIVFNKTADQLVRVMNQHVGREVFEFNRLVRLATYEATMNTICSKNCDLQNNLKGYDKESRFLDTFDLVLDKLLARLNNLLHLFDTIYYRTKSGKEFLKLCKEMRAIMLEYICERREEQMTDSHEYHDLLDLIMRSRDENGNGLTDLEMVDELSSFFSAGFDTTLGGISFLMYCLCRYPEWQAKCREEILKVLGDRESIEWEDISKFVLVNNCLKESLRLYSPVTLVQRAVNKPVKLDGYTLHKGTMVDIGIQSVHMNPNVWEDPFKFDPNRFSKENLASKHPYSFIPFSAGPRNCIGQHFALTLMKILTIKLLRSFEFTLSPGYEMVRETKAALIQKGGLNLLVKPVGS